MASSLVMSNRDTVDAKWAHDNPESAFWWAHNMYNVPASSRISVEPKDNDGLWVYRLMNHEEEVFYVGQSENLNARMKTHMAQQYGKLTEYVMAARMNSVDEMDMVESTLITGWQPQLNSALTQFGDGTSKEEANRLADSLDWELVWGFGTMFWSTDKLMEHITSCIDSTSYDYLYESMGGSVTKRDIGRILLARSDKGIADSLTVNSVTWAPSMRFLFNKSAYFRHIDEMS